MSVASDIRRVTTRAISRMAGKTPIVALTAYTTPMARLLDPHCDLLLVGDSLGMVVYGMDTTLGVTLDMMIAHGKAVVRGTQHACVIVDMPFGSYGESREQAYRNAARIMAETGAAGVKVEGGAELADTVAFLVERGIPVMGHVGLKPQAVHGIGGFRTVGRGEEGAAVVADSRAVAAAGAFAIVIEGTYEPVARAIADELDVPMIGIGASSACDGQILVTEDVVGLFAEFTPRFVKRYAELGPLIAEAAAAYAGDVRAGRFPGPEHVVGTAPEPGSKPAAVKAAG